MKEDERSIHGTLGSGEAKMVKQQLVAVSVTVSITAAVTTAQAHAITITVEA